MVETIAVTGTKGKTSLVRILDHVFRGLDRSVLRVDTSGAYVNGELRVGEQESLDRWGYTTTNCPGRFLYLAEANGIALFECTLFSSVTGLGYRNHTVGVFTNVFEDHLGSLSSLQTKDDIATRKSFVFKKIGHEGKAVYNADDPLVVGQLGKVSDQKNVTKIGVTVGERAGAGASQLMCVVNEQWVAIHRDGEEISRHPISKFAWVKAAHRPSLYLLGFAYATLFVSLSLDKFREAVKVLQGYHYDPVGGRMVEVSLDDGPRVILDFAHEKFSLGYLAEYARSLDKPGRTIAVVRLAPSRTAALIKDTAEHIATLFDAFIVYDKVDGYWRKPSSIKGYAYKKEEVGKIASELSKELTLAGAKDVEVIVREDLAIKRAVERATPEDVIIYITNDDSERSLKFLQNTAGSRKVHTL